MERVKPIQQADGHSGGRHHRFLKIQKRRNERRRAKRNVECTPHYGKYRGYEL